MSVGDGLCSLKVGVTGHVCLDVCLGDVYENVDKVIEQLNDLAGFVNHVKTLVQCDLVIS